MFEYDNTENEKVVQDLGSRYQREVDGDEDNFIFRIDCGIAFHRMGGAASAYLKDRAKAFGAADTMRAGQSAEHWLLPGLIGVRIDDTEKGNARKELSGRLTAIAQVMQAAAFKAEDIGGISKPGNTATDIAALFHKSRQSSVREALKEQKAATAPTGVSDGDISSEQPVMDYSEAIKVLRARTDLAKLNLVLERPGEVIVLVGYRDEDGDHLTTQVSIDPKVLMTLLPKPSLDHLDGRLNGVSDHVLISRHLITAREVDLPSIATDPNSAKLKAVRATLVHDRLMETSISMVGAPEMLVVTRLEADVFGDGYYVVSANSRNAFEAKVAEPVDRIGFGWGGFTDIGIEFTKGGKVTSLKVLEASDWGSSAIRDPSAHRLGKWNSASSLCVRPDQVSAMKANYLVKGCRRDLPVEVTIDDKGVSFKLGKATPMTFSAEPTDGKAKPRTVTVPGHELADVLELAISRSKDGKVSFDADPAGVLEISFADHGARHSVYLAKVTDAGARENGSVFQRYTKADFAPAGQQGAA